MNQITKELGTHYSRCFERFGPTPKGVDWGKLTDVNLRYQKMLAVISHRGICRNKHKPRILDVGCGYGGLLLYARNHGIELDYTGIDFANNMIEYAQKTIPNARFIQGDFLNYNWKNKYDYVVSNGILTQKLSVKPEQMDRFASRLIKKMFSLCFYGIAFNVMTSKVNYRVRNLYYRNPVELFKICFSGITGKILIDHAYRLYEFTVYLYREKK